MGQLYGGIESISFNGREMAAGDDLKYDLGDDVVEPVETSTRPGGQRGFTEKPGEACIEGTIFVPTEEDIEAVRKLRNTSVVMKLRTGRRMRLLGAWFTGPKNVESKESKLSVKIVGDRWEKKPA